MTKDKDCGCGCSCGGTQSGLSSPADAIMAVAVLALESDKKLSKTELETLNLMAAQSPLFDGVEDIRDYIACIAEAVSARGEEAALAQILELLSPRMRETAYAWAVQIVVADQKVVPAEHQFLSALRKALGLHGELAGKIDAVIGILNRVK